MKVSTWKRWNLGRRTRRLGNLRLGARSRKNLRLVTRRKRIFLRVGRVDKRMRNQKKGRGKIEDLVLGERSA